MAAGPGAAPWGCPAPLPVPGSPGEDARAHLRMRLPRIRNAAYACHGPALLRVRLPFWGQVSWLSQLRLAIPRVTARAFRRGCPAVFGAGGACGVGKVPRGAVALCWLSLSSSSVYSPEIPI